VVGIRRAGAEQGPSSSAKPARRFQPDHIQVLRNADVVSVSKFMSTAGTPRRRSG
jgi:hypothetical protein